MNRVLKRMGTVLGVLVAILGAASRRYLTHSGGGPGFATIFRVYPQEKLGVVVMGNDSTIDRETLADVLANGNWQSE